MMSDDWSCVQSLGQEAANAAFKKHWSSWITQADISRIKSYGLNTIRISLGYWMTEDLILPGEFYPILARG
ncbi:hypothetical protein Mapa_003193 [Marchantia paleacea]|nr:hypothetical protein Mapa_003193 [Marchantia paleacea]